MRTKPNSKEKTVVVMAMAAAGLLVAAAPAFALSVPAYSGKPTPSGAADASCMVESFGAVKNTCGQQVQWEIPLSVNEGSHSVTVSTYNPGGGTFECFLYAVDSNANTSGAVTHCFPGLNDTQCTLQATVPPQGSLYVYCNVNPNGIIFNLNYSQ